MIPSPVAAALVSPSESEPPPARSLGEAHASRALGDQVASIDRARAALAAGDAREAVAQTDDNEARFPHGSLLQEATVLRVEALLRLGDRSRAHEVGERFLAAYPTSPHAARVRQMLSPNQNP
jgi:TolA-binding protein